MNREEAKKPVRNPNPRTIAPVDRVERRASPPLSDWNLESMKAGKGCSTGPDP